MNIDQILNNVGTNLPGYRNGFLSALVVIVAVLIIIAIIKLIFFRGKKTKQLDNAAKLEEYEDRIRGLNLELDSAKMGLTKSFNEGAVYCLTLLQRGGRLVDFLKEDIKNFEDAQIGAAVRQIHDGCLTVLEDNLKVKPLVTSVNEGENMTLEEDFDASEYRLTGNIPREAPYNGLVRHKGWIVEHVNLPKRIGKFNSDVVAPAEIEF